MATEKEVIIEIDVKIDEATNDLAKSQKAVKDLKKEIKDLGKAEGDNSKQVAELTVKLQQEQKQLKENTAITKNLTTVKNTNTGSVAKLRAELSIVSQRWAKLSKEERENTEAGKALSKQKLDLTNELRKEEKATGDARRGVGFYSEGILEAIDATGGLSSGLDGAVGATKGLGTAFKALLANPIGAAIAAIAAALGFLFSSFAKTQGGADKLNSITTSLSATFEVLQGYAAILAEDLIGLFENPTESLKEFGQLLLDSIINRFVGILELIPSLGKAIVQVFEGDWSKAATTATDALGKVVFGVEGITEKITEFGEEFTEAVEKSVKSTNILLNAQIALENSIIKTTVSLAKLNKEAELEQQIADDSTVSLTKRAEAAEKSRIASESAAKVSLNLAQQELDLLQLQINIKKQNGFLTRELSQQEATSRATVIEAEKNLQLTILNNNKVRDEISRDRFEKDLDYLLDNFDNVKSLNERTITSDKETFEARQNLLKATIQLGDDSFEEQIKQLQTRTDAEINASDLLAETDSKRLIEKVRLLELDEIEETRLLEVLRDRRTAVQDLTDLEIELASQKNEAILSFKKDEYSRELELAKNNIFETLDLEREGLERKKQQEIEFAESIGADVSLINEKYARANEEIARIEQDTKLSLAADFVGNIASIAGEGTAIGKAAAIAQTTISTYQGATSAYASLAPIPIVGPALGIAAAGAAVASGLANVKKILAVNSGLPNSGGGGGSISGASVPRQSSGNIVAPNINQGIISRSTSSSSNEPNIVPVLLIDEVTDKQIRNKSNNRTRVA